MLYQLENKNFLTSIETFHTNRFKNTTSTSGKDLSDGQSKLWVSGHTALHHIMGVCFCQCNHICLSTGYDLVFSRGDLYLIITFALLLVNQLIHYLIHGKFHTTLYPPSCLPHRGQGARGRPEVIFTALFSLPLLPFNNKYDI